MRVCRFLLVIKDNFTLFLMRYGVLLAEQRQFSLPHSHLTHSLAQPMHNRSFIEFYGVGLLLSSEFYR